MKEYAQLKLELAKEYYHNTCPICKKLFDEYHLPVFHHLWYEENDAKYNMFGNKHEYLQALSWYIVDNPKRFKCLVQRLSSERNKNSIFQRR